MIGLSRHDSPLLLEVADRQRLGSTTDDTAVGQLHSGHEPEQRRLADTVRADEADPRTRTDRRA